MKDVLKLLAAAALYFALLAFVGIATAIIVS